MRDTISDTLTRLRNSSRIKSKKVIIFSTNLTRSITSILKREGYIDEIIEVQAAESSGLGEGLNSRAKSSSMTSSNSMPGHSVDRNLLSLSNHKELHIFLKYEGKKMKPSFSNLKSISTPGVRKYSKSKNIPQVLGGLGTIVLSTSQGLMTDSEARKLGLGGELLFAIW